MTTSNSIRLRPVTFMDVRRLYDWRNESETREASFNSDPIAYEDHLRWFQRRVEDGNVTFMIAVNSEHLDVGYARLDITRDTAELSVSVDKNQRGHGIGGALIQAAVRFAIEELKMRQVVARIRPNNARSIAVFRRSGFAVVDVGKHAGETLIEMNFQAEIGKVVRG